jgi:hypothetical protein
MTKWNTKHKWQQVGHKNHHLKRCIKCGCMKNEKVIGRIIYTLCGIDHINESPKCTNALLIKKQMEEQSQ